MEEEKHVFILVYMSETYMDVLNVYSTEEKAAEAYKDLNLKYSHGASGFSSSLVIIKRKLE